MHPERANPSAWSRRGPVVVLALTGCAIAAYLSLYQLGAVAAVWDPLFGRGSERILTSFVARFLPVPDAALGACVYFVEAVAAPWVVLAFGVLVAGLGLVGVCLVVAQPVLFHTGCTLCLASAVISFTNAWLARDELLATLGYLKQSCTRGHSVWRSMRGAA
jgi:hypothetical protein